MSKIAIIVASSESAIPLVGQCLTSLEISFPEDDSHEYHAYIYQCNWNPLKRGSGEIILPWEKHVDMWKELPLKKIKIYQKDASQIELRYTVLPDISAYDDFARRHLNEYDYAIFCHNDVQFMGFDFINKCIKIVNHRDCCMIATPRIKCDEYLVVRYRPHFIFVHVDKFRQADLSFANDYCFPDYIKMNKPKNDGGAGLLLSHYHKNNPTDYGASPIPPAILTHLRLSCTDQGIETYNNFFPNTTDFWDVMKDAQEFVDQCLYGE